MRRQRVEIPWPLARGVSRDGHAFCIRGWQGYRKVDEVPLGQVAPFDCTLSEINDAIDGYDVLAFCVPTTDDERALTLYGALWYAGYDPVIVDTRTREVIG